MTDPPNVEKPELLACPFCGQPPIFVADDSHGDCTILCHCPAEPFVFGPKEQAHDVSLRWNTRPTSAAVGGDALRARETINEALGLFSSAIKSGEPWSSMCQQALEDARAAISAIATRPAAIEPGDVNERARALLQTELNRLKMSGALLVMPLAGQEGPVILAALRAITAALSVQPSSEVRITDEMIEAGLDAAEGYTREKLGPETPVWREQSPEAQTNMRSYIAAVLAGALSPDEGAPK